MSKIFNHGDLRDDVETLLNTFDNLRHSTFRRIVGNELRRAVEAYTILPVTKPPKKKQVIIKGADFFIFTDEELRAIDACNKLEAIRLVKSRLHLSLLDAKHLVESAVYYQMPPGWNINQYPYCERYYDLFQSLSESCFRPQK